MHQHVGAHPAGAAAAQHPRPTRATPLPTVCPCVGVLLLLLLLLLPVLCNAGRLVIITLLPPPCCCGNPQGSQCIRCAPPLMTSRVVLHDSSAFYVRLLCWHPFTTGISSSSAASAHSLGDTSTHAHSRSCSPAALLSSAPTI